MLKGRHLKQKPLHYKSITDLSFYLLLQFFGNYSISKSIFDHIKLLDHEKTLFIGLVFEELIVVMTKSYTTY
tara:strand:+ start:24712 stop:24927 length:216 start_codon:yes stop_codon:yes gene_type:complete